MKRIYLGRLGTLAAIFGVAAMIIGCGQIQESASDMTDAERLQEIGMLWALEWPRDDRGSCDEDTFLSSEREFSGFAYDFDPSYGVSRPYGRLSVHDSAYNSHQALEDSFNYAGGWRIEIGEIDLVRERVESWRESYALWVQTAEKYAETIPDSERYAECKHKYDTIVHRGRRSLNHIDALLR